MNKVYKCVKPLVLDYYDPDGSYDESADPIVVEVGDIFEECNRYEMLGLIVAAPPAVHLEHDDGRWIEIMPETLREHFEEVSDGTIDNPAAD